MTEEQIRRVIEEESITITITLTTDDAREALLDICDTEHAGCNSECPVYAINGNKIPLTSDLSNCTCFKSGKAMLDFLRIRGW